MGGDKMNTSRNVYATNIKSIIFFKSFRTKSWQFPLRNRYFKGLFQTFTNNGISTICVLWQSVTSLNIISPPYTSLAWTPVFLSLTTPPKVTPLFWLGQWSWICTCQTLGPSLCTWLEVFTCFFALRCWSVRAALRWKMKPCWTEQ